MTSTFAKLADLPLEIESCSLRGLSREISMGFERLTTVVSLHGGGEEGVGEDVISYPADQLAFQQAGAPDLTGTWTLAELGEHLDDLDLFTTTPLFSAYRKWRLWAFHSAALDLALRQAGRSLHDVLGVTPRPMTFVLSTGIGEPPSTDGLRELLGRYPQLRLKLDASPSWDDRVLAELAEMNAIDTIDFKSFTPDLGDANVADAGLYRRVAEALPEAWLEDPNLASAEADSALAPYRDRITWDTPSRSIAEIQALASKPRMINIKPSRFGSLKELCDSYDLCAEQGIGVYAGGMFELGPGRGQAQYLASIFHAEAPNDIAPAGYNDPTPADGLPASPLAPAPAAVGFRWEEEA
jgi:L-alanine-DL-glutamate epimerase-like enolase superfamily enzyme